MSDAEGMFEEVLAKEIADLIRQHVAAATMPLRDRIEMLELRTVDAEKQAAEFRYRGVWQPSEQYCRNNFCTHDGSVWVCLRDTEGKPGQCLDWQLAVRKGRDGKDARAAA
jgi:hypothetical protein